MGGVAVLDTNVLYSSLTRSLLLFAVEQEFYRPVWSDRIFEELGRNLQAKAGCSREQWMHLAEQMNKTFPEAELQVDPALEQALRKGLPDPEDAHVVAVAVQARANFILTYNLKHFPHELMEKLELDALSPDEFFLALLEEKPRKALAAVSNSFYSLRRSSPSWPEYLGRLSRAGFPLCAQVLMVHSPLPPQI